jgi:hypothetical protein
VNNLRKEDNDNANSNLSTVLNGCRLEKNLHDIQDNVVAPILMRYGRHISKVS